MRDYEFNLFQGREVQELGRERVAAALAELEQFNAIGMSDDEAKALSKDIASRHGLNVAQLKVEAIEVGTPFRARVAANRVPGHWSARGDREGLVEGFKQRIYVPFEGDPQSFTWKPSATSYDFADEAYIENGTLVLTALVTPNRTPETLKQDVDRLVSAVNGTLRNVASDARQWPVEARVEEAIQERKKLAEMTKEASDKAGLVWRNEDERKSKISLMSLV